MRPSREIMAKKKPSYIPREYEEKDVIDREKYSEEEIELARRQVIEQDKKVSRLTLLSVIWTIVTTIYVIASTCTLLAKRWVDSTIAYVLIAILVLYIGVFIGLAAAALSNPKDGKKNVKGIKTALKILKPLMSIVLVALAVVELVGIAENIFDLPKLMFMIFTLLVAVVQLALRFTLLAARIERSRVSKGYKVNLARYVDGKKKKKSVRQKLAEKRYND